MRMEACGERLWILREFEGPAARLADVVRELRWPGVTAAYASYETVGVRTDSTFVDPYGFANALSTVRLEDRLAGRDFIVPVCFELGADLTFAAETLSVSADRLISVMCQTELQVAAIGFCPGFPYMTGLPEAVQGLPRLPQPRHRVPEGSVAITGAQCGIYPAEVPGGWNLVGRTPLVLVDVCTQFFALEAGDRIRFRAIGLEEFDRLSGERLVPR